jgi:hypothetical protein
MTNKTAKLKKEDFLEFPIWEGQGFFNVSPYRGKIPFRANKERAYYVRTTFTLGDGSKHTGHTLVGVPPYKSETISPTILTESGPVDLTHLGKNPTEEDIASALKRVGKSISQLFPLQFQTDVPVPKGTVSGSMNGFWFSLNYKDDQGWTKRLLLEYRTANELAEKIASFHKSETSRRKALEPTANEKALLTAAKLGDLDKASKLINKGVNVNRGGTFKSPPYYIREKVTPLMLAAQAGHIELVRLLLRSGADLELVEESNEPRLSGRTALAHACMADQPKATQVLLEAGADPNHRLSGHNSIFDWLCYEGSIKTIKLLLKFGADPNTSCGKANEYALERAISGRRNDVVTLLLDHKANPNCGDSDNETALMIATHAVAAEIVEILLKRGADVTSKTGSGYTALHRVVWRLCNLEKDDLKLNTAGLQIVKMLLACGADVHATNAFGETPIGRAKICKLPELRDSLVAILSSK